MGMGRLTEVNMKKKILLIGIILILVIVFAGSCNEDIADEAEIEYTDVVYSADGSQVSIYLDGAKVPVTKAQRAMTRDLAMMAYDYLEVVLCRQCRNRRYYCYCKF